MKFRVLWTYMANYADRPFRIECERTEGAIVKACREALCIFSKDFFEKATLHCFAENGDYTRICLKERAALRRS